MTILDKVLFKTKWKLRVFQLLVISAILGSIPQGRSFGIASTFANLAFSNVWKFNNQPNNQNNITSSTPILNETCSFTNEKLVGIITATASLEADNELISKISLNSNVSIVNHTAFNCSNASGRSNLNLSCIEHLDIIQESISCLSHSAASRVAMAYQKSCDEKQTKLNTEWDGLKSQMGETYQNQINATEAMIKVLEKRLQSKSQVQNKELISNIISYQIRAGDMNASLNTYNTKLGANSHSELVSIVKNAYANNTDNFDNIVLFSKILPLLNDSIVVYQALLNEIQSNNHSYNPNIILLYDFVEEAILPHLSPSITDQENLSSLKSQILPLALLILQDWIIGVRNNNFISLNAFARKSAKSSEIIQSILPEFLQVAYEKNLSNFKSIKAFIPNLPQTLIVEGYKILLDEMKNNSQIDTAEFIQLAYNVKNSFDDYIRENSNSTAETKSTWEGLKNSFPESIKKLIWNGGNCQVQNIYLNEPLFVLPFNFNTRNKELLLTLGLWNKYRVIKNSWIFTPEEDASTFTIEHSVYSYLLSARKNDAYSVYTGPRGYNRDLWILEPVDKATSFRIKSPLGSTYLSATAKDDSELIQNVFLGFSDLSSKWAIQC